MPFGTGWFGLVQTWLSELEKKIDKIWKMFSSFQKFSKNFNIVQTVIDISLFSPYVIDTDENHIKLMSKKFKHCWQIAREIAWQ